MRPFRLAPALISALLFQSTFASLVRAQPAPPPPPAEGEPEPEAEEAPMDDAEEAPPAAPPAEGSKPQAPPEQAPAEPTEEEMPADEEMPSDAEMEAEMAKELASEDAAGAAALTRPPAKGKGAIVGVVKDAVERETTPEAQVTVVGTKYKTIADFDGRYRLELPPGTYTLRIYVELYKPSVLKGVEVKADTLERFDIEVVPDEQATDTVEIVTEVDKSSVEGLLLTRQRSAAVGDGVGRAEIARTPASNAAQATQRVVGATIVGNRFVYVRGLGERYTNALLNGAPLPSPEPDRAAIPLDLFPSLILENVTIVKTFTPDVPADFAGGSVRIDTRELPSKPLFQLSVGAGFDTNATFRDRFSHPGSSTDWLGFDNNTRPLPDGFPDYVLRPGAPKPGRTEADCDTTPDACISNEDLIQAGKQINSSMHARQSFTLPNHSLSAVAGNGWRLGEEQRLGALLTLNYGRSFRRREASRREFRPTIEPGTGASVITPENVVEMEQGEDKVSWGSLGSVSYWLSQRHRLTLTGLHTQLADATTNVASGEYEAFDGTTKSTQLRYVSRALNLVQLRGEHEFRSLNSASLVWNGSYSVADRNEPDTRTTAYQFNAAQEVWNQVSTGASGVHQYFDQDEKQRGGGLDWTQPVTTNPDLFKLKLGGLVSSRDRNYKARRFVFNRKRGAPAALFGCGAEYTLDCSEKLYRSENIGTILSPLETTFPDDASKAALDIFAGYLMMDAEVLQDLRVVAGARVERTDQNITPFSQFAGGEPTKGGSIESTDVLPALSLTYSATKKTKFRAVASRTLARPQLRELSPSTYVDYFGGRQLAGNPQLRMTYINNADLRFEVFPTPREVLAFSLFYKLFKDPIEPYVTGNGVVSFQNAKGARLVGLELEARKSLDTLSASLVDLSVIANLTLAHSQIELEEDQGVGGEIVTNEDRAMVNQAPYVVNLAVDYENDPLGFNVRLLGNVVGPRIVQVGTNDLDDEYEQPRLFVDATVSKELGKHFVVKLNATNLLNAPLVFTLGKERNSARETYRESEGRVFSLSAAYTY